jgi:hypothetical protein
MKRPSRGDRLSAATTRQTGSFRVPTRVSLILTAKSCLSSLKDERIVSYIPPRMSWSIEGILPCWSARIIFCICPNCLTS